MFTSSPSSSRSSLSHSPSSSPSPFYIEPTRFEYSDQRIGLSRAATHTASKRPRKAAVCPTCLNPVRGHRKGICRTKPGDPSPRAALNSAVHENMPANMITSRSKMQPSQDMSFDAWISTRSLPYPAQDILPPSPTSVSPTAPFPSNSALFSQQGAPQNQSSGYNASSQVSAPSPRLGMFIHPMSRGDRPELPSWRLTTLRGERTPIPQYAVPPTFPPGYGPEPSVSFNVKRQLGDESLGVHFKDILQYKELDFETNEPAFRRPTSGQLRLLILWPGYEEYVESRPMHLHSGNISKRILAMEVVITYLRWIEQQSIHPPATSSDEIWKVGSPRGISVNDLVLYKLHNVGPDTWQAEVLLA